MNNTEIIVWICISLMSLLVLIALGIGVYITWFDKRLRAVLIDSLMGVTIVKVSPKHDNRFNYKEKTYTIDKEAIYRRFVKIPYAFYWVNNPNPIKFDKQTKEKGSIKPVYTSQELHDLLEVNYTMNLIKPKVNVKKLMIGTAVFIVIGAVILMILHFTGVLDLTEFMTGMSQAAK